MTAASLMHVSQGSGGKSAPGSDASRVSRGIVEKRITVPISREDMPCFVIFWLLLRPSFFSRQCSFPMMPMPAAEVAVVAIAEVEGACAPEVSMAVAIVAAPFTRGGSMAEADAITQEVRGQAIRSPVVLAVQVTPLRAVPAVPSPVIPEAIRD